MIRAHEQVDCDILARDVHSWRAVGVCRYCLRLDSCDSSALAFWTASLPNSDPGTEVQNTTHNTALYDDEGGQGSRE